MSTFYPQNDYRGYLSHHGIKGQKWGEQNGPPYPLSSKIHSMVVKGRQKRAEKRRQKILHDPKKLTKHATEFSKEEIDAAVAKIDSINKAKQRIPQKKKSERQLAKEAKKANKKFAKKVNKYGKDPGQLLNNNEKFTGEELKKALDRLETKEKIFNTKIDRINRPKKYLDSGIGYLNSAINGVKSVRSLIELFKPKYDEHGRTKEQRQDLKTFEAAMSIANKDPVKAMGMILSNKNIREAVASVGGKNKVDIEKILGLTSNKSKETIEEQGKTINEKNDEIKQLKSIIAGYESIKRVKEAEEYEDEFRDTYVNVNKKHNTGNKEYDELLNNYEYLLAMGYLEPDRMYLSEILNTGMETFYDDQNDLENYLEHYGVKGMRWGHRKADVYDDLYYRAKYNNKKVKTYADLKRKKISRGKYAVKRLGQIAGRGILDPYKLGFRSVGRDIRGGYRLVTGKTFRKTNDHEYSANRNALFNEIKDKKTMAKINYLVNQTINDNSIDNEGNPIVNMDALYDVLDRAQLKEIEKIKFNK